MTLEVTPEMLARYDRPGPRYTSYPTAVEFGPGFGPEDHRARLVAAAAKEGEPLSLYVHLPFCERRCSFCGCHVVVARRPGVATAYLEHLVAEADLVATVLGGRRRLVQYHWGGGTPTFFSPDRIEELHGVLTERFVVLPDAEVAIEVDPRVTTPEHLQVLRRLGFNRLSMGVQDLDPRVQELIGRGQTWEETRELHEEARRLGFASINVDLIYGLPGQSVASFGETLERVVALRPDRLAVYSFAYLPRVRPNQRRIPAEHLPGRDLKFSLLAQARRILGDAGYRSIGMDHFALPDDELARAYDEGTLSRNFMGYTTRRGTEVVALGTSGISDIGGAYAQNHKRLASYLASVERGELPVERGVALGPDDLLRRYVITELMCNAAVAFADVEERFAVRFAAYFAAELAALTGPGGLVAEGLVTVDDGAIRATPLGAVFIRNVAMTFDAYRGERAGRGVTFSRTV